MTTHDDIIQRLTRIEEKLDGHLATHRWIWTSMLALAALLLTFRR